VQEMWIVHEDAIFKDCLLKPILIDVYYFLHLKI
jgi:hypothetical protein